jgi:hypothetical protein
VSKQFSTKEIRWRGLMVEVSKYHNMTNYRGSKFFGSNIRIGPLRLFIKLDWVRWPDYGEKERQVEVRYMFPILGRHRAFAVELSWRADW